MASLYQPITVKPIPRNAILATVGGKRVARWIARGGQSVTAPLTPDGKKVRVKSKTWWVEYRDAARVRRRAKGFRDRAATLQLAASLEKKAEGIRAGKEEPDPSGGPTHLIDHIEEFRDHLTRAGRNRAHIAETISHCRTVLTALKVTTAASVTIERVDRWLDAEQRRLNWATDTRNHWAGYLIAFGNWLVRSRPQRAKYNPFAGLTKGNPQLDRRRVRRVLSTDSLAKLIDTTEASAVTVHELSGTDRAALYLIAAFTGRRAGALFQMTRESFTFTDDGTTPLASVSSARMQKSKKTHVVPIHPDTAARLAPWFALKQPGERLWNVPHWRARRASELLHHDLAAAGIPYQDAVTGDVFDFHALRTQFITDLARAGVPLTAAQALADHSTPALTANIYTKWSNDLVGEVAKLPSLGRGLGSKLGSVVHNCGHAAGNSQSKRKAEKRRIA